MSDSVNSLRRPSVVLLSGTLGGGSKADRIVQWCARQCPGVDTTVFTGAELEFPFYRIGDRDRPACIRRYLSAMRSADGVVLLSPAYHGTVSGLLKNALDYVNDLAQDPRPYLEGRSIGCVALALGEQGGASTVATLRTVAHALRGWPTPLGVTLTQGAAAVGLDGEPVQARTRERLSVMLGQVISLARQRVGPLMPVGANGELLPAGGIGAGERLAG